MLFCRKIHFVYIYTLLDVKFCLKKSWPYKKNDKYQVCERGLQMQGVAAMLQRAFNLLKKIRKKKRIHIFNSLLPSCRCLEQA